MKVKIGKFPQHWPWSNWLYDKFGYSPEQKVKVHIDKWDTWSMDHTLAPIILPMLIQLKDTKQGAPFVDEEDVPEELRDTPEELAKYKHNGETTDKFFRRWDWVIDEMIFAFEQKCKDDWLSDFDYDMVKAKDTQDRISNGFRLFGKYYESLWD